MSPGKFSLVMFHPLPSRSRRIAGPLAGYLEAGLTTVCVENLFKTTSKRNGKNIMGSNPPFHYNLAEATHSVLYKAHMFVVSYAGA